MNSKNPVQAIDKWVKSQDTQTLHVLKEEPILYSELFDNKDNQKFQVFGSKCYNSYYVVQTHKPNREFVRTDFRSFVAFSTVFAVIGGAMAYGAHFVSIAPLKIGMTIVSLFFAVALFVLLCYLPGTYEDHRKKTKASQYNNLTHVALTESDCDFLEAIRESQHIYGSESYQLICEAIYDSKVTGSNEALKAAKIIAEEIKEKLKIAEELKNQESETRKFITDSKWSTVTKSIY